MVGRPFQSSNSGLEALPQVREWSGGPSVGFQEWSGGTPAGPGVLGRPSCRSRSGREALSQVQ